MNRTFIYPKSGRKSIFDRFFDVVFQHCVSSNEIKIIAQSLNLECPIFFDAFLQKRCSFILVGS